MLEPILRVPGPEEAKKFKKIGGGRGELPAPPGSPPHLPQHDFGALKKRPPCFPCTMYERHHVLVPLASEAFSGQVSAGIGVSMHAKSTKF